MPTREFLCNSHNGKQVYYDPVHSNAATHFSDTPQLKALVIEVLENRDITRDTLQFDLDMGRIIGTTDVVETDKTDDIVYVLRKNRKKQGYVPFTKSRGAEESSYISISLVDEYGGTYSLSSAWIGAWDDPPFPQEPHATSDSKTYWGKHAFVWGSQEIIAGTETTKQPW
ncbi:MAG: hypothetical protein WDN27_00485 [Candidatus Saccharibacteria bacterium]